jgi:hypothetical protein
VTLGAELTVHAAGEAFVVQDDFENTYQRLSQ